MARLVVVETAEAKRLRRVNFRLTVDELRMLDAECWRRKMTVSQLMREMVGLYFSSGHGAEESALYGRAINRGA